MVVSGNHLRMWDTKTVPTNNCLRIPCFRDPVHFLVMLSKPPPPLPLRPLRIFRPFLTPSFTIFTSIALIFRFYANRAPILPFSQLARSICEVCLLFIFCGVSNISVFVFILICEGFFCVNRFEMDVVGVCGDSCGFCWFVGFAH